MSRFEPPRIVFDTNALVSAAILPHSISRQGLRSVPGVFQLVHSPATWWELYQVIWRPKFNRYFPADSRNDFLVALARISEFLETSIVITDCPDPKDNIFLELAVASEATRIVSGDGHLKSMDPYQGIRILTPAELLRTTPSVNSSSC